MDKGKQESIVQKKKDWKSSLLSSSYPLEFEMAQILTKNKYAVEGEFIYKRKDAGISKEFSVDIKAQTILNKNNDPESEELAEINLFIECKYRQPGTNWLFIPEIFKDENYTVDSQESRAINLIDEFSFHYFNKTSLNEFEGRMPLCLKGTEIRRDDSVTDSEIKHGVSQLRYALPSFLADHINFILNKSEYNIPFTICPILVTTASLNILNNNCRIKDVENSKELNEISTKVPWLVAHYNLGPDFIKHHSSIFKDNLSKSQMDVMKFIKKERNLFTKKENLLYDFNNLIYGHEGLLNQMYSKVIICSFDSFHLFLKEFHSAIIPLKDTVKYLPPFPDDLQNK